MAFYRTASAVQGLIQGLKKGDEASKGRVVVQASQQDRVPFLVIMKMLWRCILVYYLLQFNKGTQLAL